MFSDECPDGQQLAQAGHCISCQKGSYRTKGSHKTCVPCSAGLTTEKEGSMTADQCNIRKSLLLSFFGNALTDPGFPVLAKCEPGQFLVLTTRKCEQCPKGSYQDEPLQSACKPCPNDHTTADTGAKKQSECYSTNQCETGEHNCHWHAICTDMPGELFECKCKPGFRGNGTVCEDACIDYCLNDGNCKKHPTGVVECECKEHFTGQRCEIRFQPSQQKVTYIAGGVGGVVAILIVLVILIWMICFRYARSFSSCLKISESPLFQVQASSERE